MLEEDKEAIERLEELVEYGLCYNITESIQEDLKIALNLIQKQQEEIKLLRNKNKDLLRKLRNRVKEVKKLNKYSLYKEEFSRLNARIQKKDKVIDAMVNYIEDNLTVDEFCGIDDCCADNYVNGHCSKCLNCIKQYFESKALKGESNVKTTTLQKKR